MADTSAAPHLRRFSPTLFRLALVLLTAAAPVFGATANSSGAPIDSFVRISDDEGLAHSDVRAIAQDHQGFIWFGLRLGGLTRFDGYELKVHQHDPANPRTIGSRLIWSLLVDRSGTLWIGTEGGLDRYDQSSDSFVHYRHDLARPDSIANNVVTCLFQDSAGRIWAGTREGLCRLDDRERGVFTTFRRPQLLKDSTAKDTIRSIFEDTSTGLLWLGASDGLAAFDPRTGAFASFLHDPNDPESVSRNAVNKVIRDENGTFWAFTEFGVNSFVATFDHVAENTVQQPRIAFHRFIQPAGGAMSPGTNFVRDGLVDRKHRLWLATRGGLQLFDRTTNTFTGYVRKAADPTSLSDDLTQAVFEDRTGNIWVGTYAGGADRLRSEAKPFRVHQHYPGDPDTISENRIAGLAFDQAGVLWAATVNGLGRFDGARWKNFTNDARDPDSIPSNDLSTVAVAPNGDVWAGTNYGGLYRFDHQRFHSYATSTSNLPMPNGWQLSTGSQVNSILPDHNGGVWIGARAYGLDYLVGERFLHYNPQEAAPGVPAQPTTNSVLGVFAEDGALWFATEVSGLVRFEPSTQRFTAYQAPTEHPESPQSFHCIADGGNGILWIGAADGLLKFDTRTLRYLRQYTTADGLPHAAVTTIVPDRRKHLWIATANGLADFDPVSEKFRAYEKPDGLPSNVFSQRTGALGPDGRVYLGTRAGVVDFAPDELRDNPIAPPVVLTELRWIGPQVKKPVVGSHNESVLNLGDSLHVAPGQLGFTLKFSALDFSAPEKNRYRYRLDGWDTGWNSATSRERSATYTALPPGTYTFRVQGSNADLVWNEQGAAIRIVVEPHIWQTLWFRVVLGSLLLGLVGFALQLRLKSIRQRNAALERQVSLRTTELQNEISVRQTAEAALRESHAELERRVQARTAELARTNANLETEIAERKNIESQLRQSQKMEAIGLLAGGVAHDFNNLLTVVLGQSEMLGDPSLKLEEREGALRDIKAAAQRATNLTRQLLVFSRHQAMTPVAVDLNRVVADVTKLLRHVIGEHITLESTLATSPLGVVADPGMLEQVLMNMAVNARDAMPRGGCLTIATAKVTIAPGQTPNAPQTAGEFARFTVRDTGVGIPLGVLPQIFEPFFTTKEMGKGTGLGLAISLGIIQQHRGWIDVESEAGEGTAFHVHLPIHECEAETPVRKSEAAQYARGNATILLAEDEAAVRALVKHILTRQGYRVVEATSGVDALARWMEHRDEVTILVTDIVMPGGVNGHELAAQLSKEKTTLRVITMSGYDPREFVAAANEGAARPHIRKPFTADDLLRAVDSTLRDAYRE